MMNTMRKVMMVVAVLMTSCQVSEKPKTGPVAAHTRITTTADQKAAADPNRSEILRATWRNRSALSSDEAGGCGGVLICRPLTAPPRTFICHQPHASGPQAPREFLPLLPEPHRARRP